MFSILTLYLSLISIVSPSSIVGVLISNLHLNYKHFYAIYSLLAFILVCSNTIVLFSSDINYLAMSKIKIIPNGYYDSILTIIISLLAYISFKIAINVLISVLFHNKLNIYYTNISIYTIWLVPVIEAFLYNFILYIVLININHNVVINYFLITILFITNHLFFILSNHNKKNILFSLCIYILLILILIILSTRINLLCGIIFHIIYNFNVKQGKVLKNKI